MTTIVRTEAKGTIVQIMGAVVDVEFPADQLPKIYDELRMTHPGSGELLSFEVKQHLGNNLARCVAMGPTEGLQRGDELLALGRPISVRVGPQTLGRIFNVLGHPIANKAEIPDAPILPIHRPAPALEEQRKRGEVLETALKIIDVICPFIKGGKIGA